MALQSHPQRDGIRCDVRNNDVLTPIFVHMKYILLPTTVCVYNIETKKPHTISTPIFAIYFYQNIFHQFSLLAAIHLFGRSVTKSQISTSPAKKLVAVTDGVYLILFFKSFIRIYLPILQAAECNHAATNFVILYINRTQLYVLIHIVIFIAYKPHIIRKHIFALYVPQ